ncbi:unnamed protein product [Gongylonema pulchrum]|uniref:Uncharacterized protein n=1 Tax=Gongylonema pulchrum TaxID=637853 RepID=A0A3P6QZT5_9BILA|nr:unnamed protein product [Gongylonema pulchrum]
MIVADSVVNDRPTYTFTSILPKEVEDWPPLILDFDFEEDLPISASSQAQIMRELEPASVRGFLDPDDELELGAEHWDLSGFHSEYERRKRQSQVAPSYSPQLLAVHEQEQQMLAGPLADRAPPMPPPRRRSLLLTERQGDRPQSIHFIREPEPPPEDEPEPSPDQWDLSGFHEEYERRKLSQMPPPYSPELLALHEQEQQMLAGPLADRAPPVVVPSGRSSPPLWQRRGAPPPPLLPTSSLPPPSPIYDAREWELEEEEDWEDEGGFFR